MDRGFDDVPGGVPTGPRIVVPDDARELARDVEAWRREQRWARRRRALERGFVGSSTRGRAVRAPLLIAVLVGMTMLAAMLAFPTRLGTRVATAPVPLLLAAPTSAAGTVGGLLPDVTLTGPTGTTPARELRPAVLVMTSADCTCQSTVRQLADQAAADGLTVDLIATTATRSAIDALATSSSRPNLRVLVDTGGALAQAFGKARITAVGVHADGVIDSLMTNLADPAAIDAVFAGLKQPAHAGP